MKPISTHKKLIFTGCLLLLSALLSGGLFFAASRPKARLARAVRRTFQADYLGFSPQEASALLNRERFSGNVTLTLNRLESDAALPFTDPSLLEGLGLNCSFLIDKKEACLSAEADVTYLSAPYASLESYADNDRLAVRIPELFDSFLQASPRTLGRDYNGSALPKITGVRLPDTLSLRFFPEGRAVLEHGREQAFQDFAASLEVTKLPEETDPFFTGEGVSAWRAVFSRELLARCLGLSEETDAASLPADVSVYLKDGYVYGIKFPVSLPSGLLEETALLKLQFGKGACRALLTGAQDGFSADAALSFGREETVPLTLKLKSLDLSFPGASLKLYGGARLAPSSDTPEPPDAAGCLPVFELTSRDVLTLLDEMWEAMSHSAFGFVRGWFS